MPTPVPSSDYGSPDEETNRMFRRKQGTIKGTRVGLPGRDDSSQNSNGKWYPGPERKRG